MPRATVNTLVEEGRLGDAIAQLELTREAEVDSLVLSSFLSGLIGNIEHAASLSDQAISRHLTNVQRAYCLETKAKAVGPLEAQRLLRVARDLLSSGRHRIESVRFSVRHARAVLNLVGIDAAATELPKVRTAVLALGDPQSTVDLHLLSAEIEAKQNKRARSAWHLRTAASLLQLHHNVFQWARLEQIRSNLAALSSDFEGALAAAHECAKFAKEAGWTAALGSAFSNIALFKLALGDLDGANVSLQAAAPLVKGSKSVVLPVLDTRLQVLSASGSGDALQYAEAIWQTEFVGEWRYSHCGLWHQLTRARLLLGANRLDAAMEVIYQALPFAEKSGDGRLLAGMMLLAAEIHAISGRVSVATSLISRVYANCDELPLEMFGELQRVASQTTRVGQRSASSFARRAARLFASAGLETARKQVEKTAGSLQTASAESKSDSLLHLQVVHSLSTMLHAGGSAARIRIELLDLLQALGVAKEITLVTQDQNRRWIDQDGDIEQRLNLETGAGTLIRLDQLDHHSQAICVKPNDEPESGLAISAVNHLVNGIVELSASRSVLREAAPLWRDETPEQQLGMVVAADNMRQLLNATRRVAASNITVLFLGETGTGKELLARALHDASPRKDKPFVPFNCTGFPREMLDAQLFGYRRGAFTGAQEAFQGSIRAAQGGTLFLDEIGEITPDVQPKLLRFLESSEIHPIGEPRPIPVDVRVVAATNANLEQLVADGKFREDLFYRLNVVQLDVPPLRERREEIPQLVEHYLERCSRDMHKTGLRLAEETMEYLILYKWPGNVRQLANEVRRLVAFAESGAVLMPEHLSSDIAASRRTIPASERDLAPTEFVVRVDQPMAAAVEHVERTLIQYAFKNAGGMEEAAQLLGLSRKGLYLKRQRLGLEIGEPEPVLSPVRAR